MKFPVILIYSNSRLVQARKSEFYKHDCKFISSYRIRLKGASKPQNRITTIIDFEGFIYHLELKKLHRNWLAPLSPIIDFVTMDATLSEPTKATIGELQLMAKAWKNQWARLFRKFLNNQDANALFDSKMFRAAWEHSYINLPEHEWGEEI